MFAESYKPQPIVVILMTGDKGLIHRVNHIPISFDLVVVIKRGKRDLRNVTGHCRNVRRENSGRRLQIYMFEEVTRAGQGPPEDIPKNDVDYFAQDGIEDLVNPHSRRRHYNNRASRGSRGVSIDKMDNVNLDTLFEGH